ncbi:hypothetical protein [Sphingomicrobium nitratireducens]|uniref:hypothetical protein n=1 Tax=Sphingomicrobium nitratireducens TaxID=2964666 RepID=UPI00223F98D8|nr:hypothetical protein [Sphingomicrobium nitratireducens]
MCTNPARPLFWGCAMIMLSLVAVYADWNDGAFWAVFAAFLAMAVGDLRRHARSC